MPANWYTTFGGENCSSPKSIADSLSKLEAAGKHTFMDSLPLWRRANSYACPLGSTPGVGYVLMSRGRLDKLDRNAYHTLTFRDDQGAASMPGMVIVSAKSMFGRENDADSPMLVEFMDRRRVVQRSVVANVGSTSAGASSNTVGAYNVMVPTPPNTDVVVNRYYLQSLRSNKLWTWQQMLTDLWSFLPDAGPAPALPYAPKTTPENFEFYGSWAWEAIHQALEVIGCTTQYDPFQDKFFYVRMGDSQGLDATRKALQNRLRLSYSAPDDFNAGNMPEKVAVLFARHEKWYGTERDTVRALNNWEMYPVNVQVVPTNVPGAKGTIPVWQDRWVLANHMNPGNAVEVGVLAQKAQEIARNIADDTPRRKRLIYAGAITQIIPGPEVSGVLWRDYEDGAGLVTEVTRAPTHPWQQTPGMAGTGDNQAEHVLTPHERENMLPQDLMRKSRPLYPHLKQIVQVWHDDKKSCEAVSPINGTFGDTGKTAMFHPAVVRLIRDGLEVMEPCFIVFLNCFLDLGGNVSTNNRSLFHGRLSGTARVGGTEWPLYSVIHDEQIVFVQLTECLFPGDSGKAGLVKQFCDGCCESSNVVARVADPNCQNMVLPGECVPVVYKCQSNQHEIVGSHGLRRRGFVEKQIDCFSSGEVGLCRDTGNCGSSSSGGGSGCEVACKVTACNDWGMVRKIAPQICGTQVTEQVWLHYSSGCPQSSGSQSSCACPGKWHIEPFPRTERLRGRLTGTLCPSTSDGARFPVVATKVLDSCANSVLLDIVKEAANPLGLCGCDGDIIDMVWDETISCYYIQAVQPRQWIMKAVLGEDACGGTTALSATLGTG